MSYQRAGAQNMQGQVGNAAATTMKAKVANEAAQTMKNGAIKMYKGLRVGSRAQVWHGTADVTAANKKGLQKVDLTMNPRGHIVSKKQREAGQKAFKRLEELGFAPKKGQPFVAFGHSGKSVKAKKSHKKAATMKKATPKPQSVKKPSFKKPSFKKQPSQKKPSFHKAATIVAPNIPAVHANGAATRSRSRSRR